MITIPINYLLVVLACVYVVGMFACMAKMSKQEEKYPELYNPMVAVGGLIASFGSWFTYFWMKKQDRHEQL